MVGRNLGVSCSDRKSRPTSFEACPIVAISAKGLGTSRSIKAIAMSSRTSSPPVPSSARLPPVQENSMPQNDYRLYAARSRQLQDPEADETIAGDRPPWSSGYQGTWHTGGGDRGHRDHKYFSVLRAAERDSDRLSPAITPSSRRSRSLWSRRSSWRTTTPTRVAPLWCSTRDERLISQFYQRARREGPGHAAQLGLSLHALRQLHVGQRVKDRRQLPRGISVRAVGLSHCSGIVPAVHLAAHAGHFGHVRGCEVVQRQRGLVPLGLQGLSLRLRHVSATARSLWRCSSGGRSPLDLTEQLLPGITAGATASS